MLIVGLSLSLSLSLHRHPEGSAKAEGELVAQAKSIRSICTNQFTEPGSTITSHHTIHYSRFSISQLYIAMDVGNPIPKAPIEDSSYQRFVGKNGMVYYSTEMVYYWDLLGLPP